MNIRIMIETDDHGQIYIHFIRRAPFDIGAFRTVEVFPGVFFDLDREGQLLGIDIADARELLGIDHVNPVIFDRIVGVKEAAELFGVAKSNFLRDFAAKPGFPRPVAELASGRIWLLSEILAFLKEHRAPPPEGSIGSLLNQYLKLKEATELAGELETQVETLHYLARDHRPPDQVREEKLAYRYGLTKQASSRLLHKLNLLKALNEEKGRDSGEIGGGHSQKKTTGGQARGDEGPAAPEQRGVGDAPGRRRPRPRPR